MAVDKLRFAERPRFKFANRMLPFRKPELTLVDKLDVELRGTKISQVSSPPLTSPLISSDHCLIMPEITELVTLRNALIIEDLTIWLREQLPYPQIESFPMLTHAPKRQGKLYQPTATTEIHADLFDSEEGESTCIHGLKKRYCSTCIEKEKQHKERTIPHIDPFDLVFPILQPPLGDDFDNPVAFPLGQELYPFQRDGIKFLAQNERALLGDEMGLGKSIQAIIAIRFLFRMGSIADALILCPKSVVSDWEKKLWEWAPELRVVRVKGLREQRQIPWNSPAHVYLSTYETLRQDSDSNLESDVLFANSSAQGIVKKLFSLVVLDEIQKIKNPRASITKAVRQLDARWRWGLSGTPLENRIEELISIFAYLKPGLLHYDDANIPLKVKNAISDYFLRRKKSTALPNLPQKVCDEVWLELSDAQRETYERTEQEGVVALNKHGDFVTVQHILALITGLKQICNIDPMSGESCKLEYLLEKIEEITEQGDKALVFSQYPEKTLKVIEPKLKQFEPIIYHGSLSDSQRDEKVKLFQESEGNKVLLMSVKAGGLGLTLTQANHIFHFDLWWNPASATQAEDRAHRIGQTKRVFVSSLFTINTIEERIQNLLKRKREIFDTIIDDLSDKNLKASLSEKELFSLFNIVKEKSTVTKGVSRGSFTAESLAHITPHQFEKLTADLYEKMGYQVKLTPQTRDQGIDILAKRQSESGLDYLAIQCKHYPNRMVGIEHARALYGVIHDKPSITKGILITSGSFSRECKDFVRDKRINLFDGIYVIGLLEKYGLSPS